MPTPSDGFCYLNAVQQCLALDHKKFYSITQLQSLILTHLLHNHDKYKSFHDGDICKDTQSYFNSGSFTQNIVDILVYATPPAVKFNMYLYQKGQDSNVQVTENLQNPEYPTIHVFFDYNKNYDLGNHYMSIVKMCVKPRDQRLVADNLSVCSISSQSSAESNFNDQYDQYKFPTHLFAGLEPEPVDFLPGDINGMQLFRLQATAKNCWKVVSHLRYFKMNTSSRKHLTGKRKIDLCMGNTICNNDLCSYRIWLLDAAKDDTTTMIIQCANLQKYKEQTQVDIGSLASNQVNRAANARNQQLSMAKAYVQELQNPDHCQQHLEEHNSPGIFIPGGNAQHKAGRGTGIQGSYVGVGRAKETNIVRGRGRGRGRGRPIET